MSWLLSFVLTAVLASGLAAAAPAAVSTSGSSVASAAQPSQTVPLASDDPNGVLWNTTTDTDPQPIRGKLGGTILAQQNIPLQEQNPDIFAKLVALPQWFGDDGDLIVVIVGDVLAFASLAWACWSL